MSLTLLTTIIIVHFFGLASPGPDFIVTAKNSITNGRRSGILTALGIALGITVHLAYCIAGLALIISQSLILFNTIKLLGGIYLIYIGIKSFRSKGQELQIEKDQHRISDWQSFKMGFITNTLNPKASVYFLSLFTFIISPELSAANLGIISSMLVIETAIWFSFVATILTQEKIQKLFNRAQNFINKTFGVILVAIGLKIAIPEK